ncbi:MAG: YvcK family protein [Firmicutes bacterium]|nr:YvcK family protein [Bacillota bacterium]
MKKIVIFGGGTGLSCVLSGLKLFPVEVTSVIAVSDDGSSTGVLKEELDIPAVGDLGKVLLSMANVDEDFLQLLSYRFKKDGTLYNHPVRNILMAALIDLKGDLSEASKYMCKLLNIKGEVLPLTEEKVDLIGYGEAGTYVGECEVSRNIRNINELTYDHPIQVSWEVIEKMQEADLIILSPGSLYTSIIPHLIAPDVKKTLSEVSAPIMYISNLVCQPGETDEYTVSDHVKALNRYLGDRKVDIVVANNGHVAEEITDVYRIKEQKSIVNIDEEELEHLGVTVIADDVVHIDDNGSIRHNELKTAYLVFSYLMES